jgi:hypothetical protein
LDSSGRRKSNPYAGINRIRFEGFPRWLSIKRCE